MVPRGTPPPTGDLFAPLTPLQGEVPEERGHSGTSLSSRAGSAVPRDGCRRFIRLNRALTLTFYEDFWQAENNASIATDVIANRDHVRFSYLLFSVFASWRQHSCNESLDPLPRALRFELIFCVFRHKRRFDSARYRISPKRGWAR